MASIRPMELEKMPYTEEEPLTCGGKVKRWCKKYLLEGNFFKHFTVFKVIISGQHLEEGQADKMANLPENPTFGDLVFIKYRKFVAMLIPFLLIHVIF